MKRQRLLCVDDDSGIRELYHSLFTSYGYEVILAGNAQQALEQLNSRGEEISGIISDFDMPEMDGAQLAAIVKQAHPELPFIIISGSPQSLEDVASSVDLTISKGCPVKDLMEQVETALVPRDVRFAGLSGYVSLGSALAGVASAAFLLSRLLR